MTMAAAAGWRGSARRRSKWPLARRASRCAQGAPQNARAGPRRPAAGPETSQENADRDEQALNGADADLLWRSGRGPAGVTGHRQAHGGAQAVPAVGRGCRCRRFAAGIPNRMSPNAKLPPPVAEDSQLEVLVRPGLLADVEIIVEKYRMPSTSRPGCFREGRQDDSLRPKWEPLGRARHQAVKRSESTMVIAGGLKPGETSPWPIRP